MRRLSREGAWVVLGQALTIVGSLALVRVLTERLDPAGYGRLALGLTIAAFVGQAVVGGLVAGIGRYYPVAVEEGVLPRYLAASARLMKYAALAISGAGLALLAVLALTAPAHWIPLVAAVLVFALVTAANLALGGIQNAARQRAIVALHAGAEAWLRVGLAIVFIALLGATGAAAVVGYAAAALIVTASQWGFLRRQLDRDVAAAPAAPDGAWERRLVAYAWPFSLWGVFTWLQLASDRWALEAFATTTEVGQYAVLYQLGYVPIGLATGMAVSFVSPILFQRSGGATDPDRVAEVHRLAWAITLVSVVGTLLAFGAALLLHRWVFLLLVAPAFRSVSQLLPWVVLGGGLFAAGQMLAVKLMAEMKVASMAVPKIGSALLGVGLNLAGAKLYGLEGVVGALVVFSLIYFAWMARLAWHVGDPPSVAVTR